MIFLFFACHFFTKLVGRSCFTYCGTEGLQQPVPRPFYCSADSDTGINIVDGGFFVKNHGWYFFEMPSKVSLNTSISETSWLYVSPIWTWEGQ